jgi:hypothetical protein
MTRPGSAALSVVCAWLIAISAAAAPPESSTATQGVAPDQESEALLLKVVHQIVVGHTVSPLDDSALGTWEEVRKRAQEPTPAVTRALEDFIKLSESRAATERSAGHEMVAFDLRAFGDMAQELLQHALDTQSHPEQAAVPAGAAPPPSDVSPPPVEPTAAAVKAPTSDATVALAVPIAPPARQFTPAQEQMAATLTSRGDAMLAIKDISAARKLYEQAATMGNAAAAKGLARTYDPDYVKRLGIIGMRPDVAMAASWYDRAAALGDREAAQRVQELDAMLGTPPPAKATP